MKKQILLTLLSLIIVASAMAQGIKFESGDWKSVVAKAKKDKKLVYIDVYTTWCGPCKMLEKQVFPTQEAGDKYNKLFINYRIDAEKGEGIELAKKYQVNGYPTHLFIDPDNETVVYREMGASPVVSDFNHHADVAILEKNDPMSWDKYVQQHKKGKKDMPFLTAYLEKAKRLDKNNDAALNDYVAQLKGEPKDTTILFLAGMMQTVDNKAMPLIAVHKEVISRQMPDNNRYYESKVEGWAYGTLKKAADEKNEGLLNVIDNARQKYLGKGKDATYYTYRAKYYSATGNGEQAKKASVEEADYLAAKKAIEYQKEDETAIEDIRSSLKAQLLSISTPAEKVDDMVNQRLDSNPAYKRSISSEAATRLNDISWKVYERSAKEETLVKKAMGWSKRSLELAEGMSDWPAYADTYAHLLYTSGDKAGAVKIQQEAVNKARDLDGEMAKELEASLQKMKEGSL